jgi:regulator of ribonuclease activity A
MHFTTADLYDGHENSFQVADPIFRDYGGRLAFCGPAFTLRVYEDNSLVRQALEQAGEGRVLVVDGGGSLRCALLGDQLAKLALENSWAGVLVHGCVRDSQALAAMPLGVKALATNPRKSVKRGQGESQVTVSFAGVTIAPNNYVYADSDGLLVARLSVL